MNMTIDTLLQASPDQVSCDLAGETAILQIRSGFYYALDPVGTRIWNLIRQPASVASVRDAIVSEYDVTPEHCEADLFCLLEELREDGLVQIHA